MYLVIFLANRVTTSYVASRAKMRKKVEKYGDILICFGPFKKFAMLADFCRKYGQLLVQHYL